MKLLSKRTQKEKLSSWMSQAGQISRMKSSWTDLAGSMALKLFEEKGMLMSS